MPIYMKDEDRLDQFLINNALNKKDKHAFNTIVLKYQYRLFKIITQYISDSSEVSDIVQEVFIKAYNSLHTFRGDSAFYTWLYRIAINTAKNYCVVKNRQANERHFEPNNIEQCMNKKDIATYHSPEQKLMDEELDDVMLKMVEILPLDLKNTILLRNIDGLTYDEIASVMNCPVGTVRSRIYRAREVLGKDLH